MSAEFTWKVTMMESYPTYETYSDVVFKVHWDCLGKEEYSGSTYVSRTYGVNDIQFHSGSSFISYNDLKQDDVLGWLFASMGTDTKLKYEASVQKRIDDQIVPPVVILPLPWISGSLPPFQ